MRVLKAMYLTPRPAEARRSEDALPAGAYAVIIALPVLLMGIGVTPVWRLAGTAAAAIFHWPNAAAVAQLPHGM